LKVIEISLRHGIGGVSFQELNKGSDVQYSYKFTCKLELFLIRDLLQKKIKSHIVVKDSRVQGIPEFILLKFCRNLAKDSPLEQALLYSS
jgi:hypothetical protein